MKNELLSLIKRNSFKYLVILLVFTIVFPLFQYNTSNEYNSFFEKYTNRIELFESDQSYSLIPSCNEGRYIYNQIQYLKNRDYELSIKADILARKMNSSLFKDDYDRLQTELNYVLIKENASVNLYDTYVNNQLLNNRIPIYLIYFLSIVLFLIIIYDDIRSNQIQMFKTYYNRLSKTFIIKLCTFIFSLGVISLLLMLVEIISMKGNYSIYNLLTFSNTYKDFTLVQYVVFKYIHAFLNSLLFSSIYIVVTMITRSEVVGFIHLFIVTLINYFTYTVEKSAMKYFNLFYIVFDDRMQFNGVNTPLLLFKIVNIIFLIGVIWILYVKDYSIKIRL